MKIGYLGPKGTFSEYSAMIYTKNIDDCEFVPYPEIEDVLKAVNDGEIDNGIVPLENSIEGNINNTIDTLIFDYDFYIIAEVIISVSHSIMVKPENYDKTFDKILSHPQPLGQCQKYIKNNFPNCQKISVNSTADAARTVVESDDVLAAIANENTAKIYGLKILHKEIQDNKNNKTRFVVVKNKQDYDMSLDKFKASVAFSTQNEPGELYKVLDIFNIWNFNMTKIESRPMKNKLGEYVFFIDLEGDNITDLNDALKMVERKSTFYKFLGCYPIGNAAI